MEDDTTRLGQRSFHHDDRPPEAAKQKMEAKSGTGDPTGEPVLFVEASTRQPQRDNKQQERPSSRDAGYADVSGEGSNLGPFAATVEADSHSERSVIAALGHGWPADDLDSMFDTAEENAPLPESLPAHLQARKDATDETTAKMHDTHDVSSRTFGHDIGVEDSSDGNMAKASASRGDDDNNIRGASSSEVRVAATGDGEGQSSSTGSSPGSATYRAGGCGTGTGAVARAAGGVDADTGAGSIAQADGVSAVTNTVGSPISAATAAATVAAAAGVGEDAGAGAGSVAQTDAVPAFTDAVGSPTATAADAAAAIAATATIAVAIDAGEETGVILAGEPTTGTPPLLLPLPPPIPRRTPATPRAAASAGEHDDWKDYSCATPWEYFINDIGNAMGHFESREAVAAGTIRSGASADGEGGRSERWREELTYLGRPYVLRKLLQRDTREVLHMNERGRRGGVLILMHGRSRVTIDPRTPTMAGRST